MKCTMRINLKERDMESKNIGIHKILEVFDDIAQELLIRDKGCKGNFKEYEELKLIKPLVYGDYVDVVGSIISFDDKILKIKFKVLKVLDGEREEYLLMPELLCEAIGVFEAFENSK